MKNVSNLDEGMLRVHFMSIEPISPEVRHSLSHQPLFSDEEFERNAEIPERLEHIEKRTGAYAVASERVLRKRRKRTLRELNFLFREQRRRLEARELEVLKTRMR